MSWFTSAEILLLFDHRRCGKESPLNVVPRWFVIDAIKLLDNYFEWWVDPTKPEFVDWVLIAFRNATVIGAVYEQYTMVVTDSIRLTNGLSQLVEWDLWDRAARNFVMHKGNHVRCEMEIPRYRGYCYIVARLAGEVISLTIAPERKISFFLTEKWESAIATEVCRLLADVADEVLRDNPDASPRKLAANISKGLAHPILPSCCLTPTREGVVRERPVFLKE